MRKSLPILLTGLLSAPALGAAPPILPAPSSAQSRELSVYSPAQANLAAEIRRQFVSLGTLTLDANGMQNLHRRMSLDMHDSLHQSTKNSQFHNAQLVAPTTPAAPAVHLEKAAYLGVATSPVTVILREQLNLKAGMGLVVDFVEQNSPADSVGLKVHDILEKFDDQWLINPQQLAVLVRSHKPGEKINFTVIHGGQRTSLAPVLAEKEMVPLEFLQDPALQNSNPITIQQPQIFQTLPFTMNNVPDNNFASHASYAMSRDDGEHLIAIEGTEKGRMLKITEKKSGKILFNAAYNTDKDLESLPEDLQTKVKALTANVTIQTNSSNVTPAPTTHPATNK